MKNCSIWLLRNSKGQQTTPKMKKSNQSFQNLIKIRKKTNFWVLILKASLFLKIRNICSFQETTKKPFKSLLNIESATPKGQKRHQKHAKNCKQKIKVLKI